MSQSTRAKHRPGSLAGKEHTSTLPKSSTLRKCPGFMRSPGLWITQLKRSPELRNTFQMHLSLSEVKEQQECFSVCVFTQKPATWIDFAFFTSSPRHHLMKVEKEQKAESGMMKLCSVTAQQKVSTSLLTLAILKNTGQTGRGGSCL